MSAPSKSLPYRSKTRPSDPDKPTSPTPAPPAGQPRRARPQGPPVEVVNRYSTLPDLRFLNHNKPPANATSLLDPTSVNSMNVQQHQALVEAEAWFTATATLMKERVMLCERLRDGLGAVNGLLARIEMARARGLAEGVGGAGVWVKDAGENDNDDVQSRAEVDNGTDAGGAGVGVESNSVALSDAKMIGDDLGALEDAVNSWLRDIRVSRAKWIAGGSDVERRIGLQ